MTSTWKERLISIEKENKWLKDQLSVMAQQIDALIDSNIDILKFLQSGQGKKQSGLIKRVN